MSISTRPTRPSGESVDSEEYYKIFRRNVFKLVKMGYDRLDAVSFKDSEEPDITGELVKQIREVIQGRSVPDWACNFAVHDDPPVNVPGRLGKRRPRLDIELELTGRGPHPRYPFEAKRLSGKTFGARKYLGEGGLMDFLCGKYASKEPEAGMLGYVQSDTQEEWAIKIERQFKRAIASMQICPGGNWCSAKEMDFLSHCYCSKHNRPSIGKPITMYHLLLLFHKTEQGLLFRLE